MKRIVLLSLLFLWASPSWAAITFDAASNAHGTTSSSGSHTVAADANIVIVCAFARDNAGAVQPISGVTVDGAAASLLASSGVGATVLRAEIWYKLAPSTGAVTVAVTPGAGTDATSQAVMSFKGVAQTSTFNTPSTAGPTTSQNADVTSIASAVGEMGIDCINARVSAANSFSADATAPVSTERVDAINSSTGTINVGAYTEDGAASTIDMRVDTSENSEWVATAASMRAAASTRRPQQPVLLQ